ncbi:MAG TPA: hypothetical protein VHA11_08770 [Bryobacteraceae bacterium]|nr:hypothetical protein [Bryobacteraceae bacterium]
MKKLGITLMAAALSMPAMFAAAQAESTPAPAGQAQTDTAKPAKKSHKVKKHHSKRAKASKGSAATTGTTEAPASK